jgi:hypothetical protein
MTIFQARTNTTAGSIGGNGSMNLTGTPYFPQNSLDLGGSGTGDFIVGNQLIARKLSISGSRTVTVNYDGRNPAPGHKVFLVH